MRLWHLVLFGIAGAMIPSAYTLWSVVGATNPSQAGIFAGVGWAALLFAVIGRLFWIRHRKCTVSFVIGLGGSALVAIAGWRVFAEWHYQRECNPRAAADDDVIGGESAKSFGKMFGDLGGLEQHRIVPCRYGPRMRGGLSLIVGEWKKIWVLRIANEDRGPNAALGRARQIGARVFASPREAGAELAEALL